LKKYCIKSWAVSIGEGLRSIVWFFGHGAQTSCDIKAGNYWSVD
jgi:hypothetical protein